MLRTRGKNRTFSKCASLICILALGTDTARAGEYAKKDKRTEARKADLIDYTRYYEKKMGLEENQINFVPDMEGDKYCGHIDLIPWVGGENTIVLRPTVVYSTSPLCEKIYTSEKLARHEVCHLRMQHEYLKITTEEKEKEVELCMDWYKKKNTKRATLFQVLAFVVLF